MYKLLNARAVISTGTAGDHEHLIWIMINSKLGIVALREVLHFDFGHFPGHIPGRLLVLVALFNLESLAFILLKPGHGVFTQLKRW